MQAFTPATQQAILSYQSQLNAAIDSNIVTEAFSEQLLDWFSDQIAEFSEYEQACMFLGLA